MTDVVAEIKETVEVSEEVEKVVTKDEVSKNGKAVEKVDEVVPKNAKVVENGDATEEKTENGTKDSDKPVENGDVKENGTADKEEVTKESSEVCGIKRKSEVGLESEEAPVETSEKKQKVEESAEPEVATNGC